MSVATRRVTTENAPFADRNKNFLTFLKTFEIASLSIRKENIRKLLDKQYRMLYISVE